MRKKGFSSEVRAILVGPLVDSDAKKRIRSLRIQQNDFIVAVDGGVNRCLEMGLRPHFAVGDWDSLENSKAILEGIKHISLLRNKDRSDLFFAGIAALEAGATQVLCLGVTGARPDHHLAMLYDLADFASGVYGKLKAVSAIGPDGDYHFLSQAIPHWKGRLPKATTLSLFALRGPAEGVTLAGFQFPLIDTQIVPSSLGLSNRTSKRICEVHLRKGELLVIIPRVGIESA